MSTTQQFQGQQSDQLSVIKLALHAQRSALYITRKQNSSEISTSNSRWEVLALAPPHRCLGLVSINFLIAPPWGLHNQAWYRGRSTSQVIVVSSTHQPATQCIIHIHSQLTASTDTLPNLMLATTHTTQVVSSLSRSMPRWTPLQCMLATTHITQVVSSLSRSMPRWTPLQCSTNHIFSLGSIVV